MDVTKPCDFIGFGAMDVTKPYEFISLGANLGSYFSAPSGAAPFDGYPKGSGPPPAPPPNAPPRARHRPPEAMDVTKPYEFIGFGAMAVTKPGEFIGFGAMAVNKPYKFIGFGDIHGGFCFLFIAPTTTRSRRPGTRAPGHPPHMLATKHAIKKTRLLAIFMIP